MPDRPKILIVEDDDDVREALVALLDGEGYESRGAPDGSVALTFLTRFVPRAILLDLFMPEMSGQQLLEVLQRDPQWSSIRIVICSATLVPHDIRSTVFGVLQKPFDLDRLLELVASACQGRQ